MPELKHRVISREDLQKLTKSKGLWGKLTSSFLMKAFRLNKLNKVYDACYDSNAIIFAQNCIKYNNNSVKTFDSDLAGIPESGPLIFLFNHPFGGLDALVIIETILKKRPETKFIANFLLSRVGPAAPHLLQVNPFESRKGVFSSLSGLKEMYKIIEEGGAVCILPAGEVSTKYDNNNFVEDRDWQENIMKFIKSSGAPVISGFVSGKNSKTFHFLGRINPALRTARLPAELLNKKNLEIVVRFSHVLSPKVIKSIEDNKKLATVLKSRTYLLETDCCSECEPKPLSVYKEIIEACPVTDLQNDIDRCKENDLLFSTDNYQVFFSDYSSIPVVFKELSRLREITFREIGEGTGKELDTDSFDKYYKHLFIWDDAAKALVGAYRIGMGADILKDKGVEGFYINTLFKFDNKFTEYLGKSMEMGRSFIVPDYQRKPLPLFLLWKGIYFVTQRFPEYKYLIGPASISSMYSLNAKILLIEYLKRHHGWPELEPLVNCRITFKYKTNHHHENILNNFGDDISIIDRFIRDIDVNHYGIPVLIKKYLSLGGRILEFNVDPDFNYAIDGFVVLDIDVVSEEVINSYNK
ncbi:MAG: GNAT family N-acetyltransferase [Bacteroidales bacterium]|nr:GNAT family N-acetyltransferase [Bacteroidales bacterium]